MPNKPKTPVRTIRICDADWDAATALAKEQGTNVTWILREELRLYTEQYQKTRDGQNETWFDRADSAGQSRGSSSRLAYVSLCWRTRSGWPIATQYNAVTNVTAAPQLGERLLLGRGGREQRHR